MQNVTTNNNEHEIKEIQDLKYEKKYRKKVPKRWCITDGTNICQIYSEEIDWGSCPYDNDTKVWCKKKNQILEENFV